MVRVAEELEEESTCTPVKLFDHLNVLYMLRILLMGLLLTARDSTHRE
jgi:hypothetical protein|tara:strand:- start:2190 stop:2333 length:144 start_codon:yes stop_codon:yes gene_type:complete